VVEPRDDAQPRGFVQPPPHSQYSAEELAVFTAKAAEFSVDRAMLIQCVEGIAAERGVTVSALLRDPMGWI
jgi:hypothetical protein